MPRERILNITKIHKVTGPATLPLRHARAMAARAPPAARLELDVGFHKIKVAAFDGTNFETSPDYGTVCSAGLYNSPWQGDHFNYEAAEADYTSFCLEDKAAHD